MCSVKFNGTWAPFFVCSPGLPGNNNINQTSPNNVEYRHVIAASDIEDFTEFNCSVTFALATDYRRVKLEKPIFEFVWKTPAIHIVNASGKYMQINGQAK